MEGNKQKPESLLIEWHMGLLDESDRIWFDKQCEQNPALRAKCEQMGRVLEPLDAWATPAEPTRLPEHVLAFIERSNAPWGQTSAPRGRSWPFSLKELVAVAACILLLLGVGIPGLSSMRSLSKRTTCAAHLRSVHQGLGLYRAACDEALPFAGAVAGGAWLPDAEGTRPYASNSRHLYLLVRGDFGPRPEHFICPSSSSRVELEAGDLTSRRDFVDQRYITYASLNLSGDDPDLRPPPTVAYMSDANPLFADGRFHVGIDADVTNSSAHGQGGQSVLTLDGSVQWLTSPVYGSRRDNLWTVDGIDRYTGTESQTIRTDAFLIPGISTPGSPGRGGAL